MLALIYARAWLRLSLRAILNSAIKVQYGKLWADSVSPLCAGVGGHL